jgi:hypothetical protein
LFEPTRENEIRRLRQRQLGLQAHYGGQPIEHVHLTCERFLCPDKTKIPDLVQRLAHDLAQVEPFTLTACALETLYVPMLQCHILKWEIEISQELGHMVQLLRALLSETGMSLLYAPEFVSSLVSALKDLSQRIPDRLDCDMPYPLFTVNRVLLSEILAPNEFKIMAAIDLPRRSQT